MRPALLTDLDRTLTGPDLRLDARAHARIRDLRAAGVPVIVATGRPLAHVDAIGLGRDVAAV
ncbi:MAG TPA: HAD hydrolase family protein, partial [Candidatus Thermoplasmatota archaeon]|nr:HAD hydrolase family protein [Candidatus Thermoplasmatota archaeon]